MFYNQMDEIIKILLVQQNSTVFAKKPFAAVKTLFMCGDKAVFLLPTIS